MSPTIKDLLGFVVNPPPGDPTMTANSDLLPKSAVTTAGPAGAGLIPVADGLGGYTWTTVPSSALPSSVVNATAAGNGQAPIANGSGGYAWTTMTFLNHTNPSQVNVTTSNLSLTTTEQALVASMAITAPTAGRLTLAFATCPFIGGNTVASGAGVYLIIRSGTSSAGTEIGEARGWNMGAAAGNVSALVVTAPVPLGTTNLWFGTMTTTGTGTMTGSATQPIVGGVLYF